MAGKYISMKEHEQMERNSFERRKILIETEIRLEKEKQKTYKMQGDFEKIYIQRLKAEHALAPKIKKDWKEFWDQQKTADEKHKKEAKKEMDKMFG